MMTLKEKEQIKTKMISIKLRTKEHGSEDKVHVSSVPTSNDLQKLNMYQNNLRIRDDQHNKHYRTNETKRHPAKCEFELSHCIRFSYIGSFLIVLSTFENHTSSTYMRL